MISSYRDNIKKMSALSKDYPDTPIERTVWWTEYVLRHKGAQHLRTAAVDLEWYQYLLLDVIAFILILTLIVVFILYYLLKILFSYLYKKTKNKSKTE